MKAVPTQFWLNRPRIQASTRPCNSIRRASCSERSIGREDRLSGVAGFRCHHGRARKVRVTRDRKSYEMKGTSIIGFIREYSFTFNLASHPGDIVPNFLT